jgi:hypothetical protein
MGVALAAIVCSCTSVLYLAVQEAREAARGSACKGHIFQTAIALLNYESSHNALPPAYLCDKSGNPTLSWRVLILPYLDNNALYQRFDPAEPWNGPNNRPLLNGAWGHLYACPSDPDAMRLRSTSYVAVVGPNTLWPGDRPYRFEYPGKNLEDKILLVEIPYSNISWTKPLDISVEEALSLFSAKNGFKNSRHPDGLHYVTFGGAYRSFSSIATVEEFANMLDVTVHDSSESREPETGSAK